MALLMVHGGCANLTDPAQTNGKRDAALAAFQGTRSGSALDCVEQAVTILENDPRVNAGTGSVVQMDGRIRMDAAVCTSAGGYAAVMQIEQVRNPIRVARRLCDIGYHSILSGDGARLFALEQGFPSESPFTAGRLEEYHHVRESFPILTYANISRNIHETNTKKLSTVGAVALDDAGGLAAACSTGGTKFCYPGRVGDTPVYGAGVYCSPHVAVACTGEGDKVLRRLSAKKVEEFYLSHGDLQKAAEEVVFDLWEAQKGFMGLIALSRDGQSACAHNTVFMAHAGPDGDRRERA